MDLSSRMVRTRSTASHSSEAESGTFSQTARSMESARASVFGKYGSPRRSYRRWRWGGFPPGGRCIPKIVQVGLVGGEIGEVTAADHAQRSHGLPERPDWRDDRLARAAFENGQQAVRSGRERLGSAGLHAPILQLHFHRLIAHAAKHTGKIPSGKDHSARVKLATDYRSLTTDYRSPPSAPRRAEATRRRVPFTLYTRIIAPLIYRGAVW
jgi:hypothetical protein